MKTKILLTAIIIILFWTHGNGQLIGTTHTFGTKIRDCASLNCNIVMTVDSGKLFWVTAFENEEIIGNYGSNYWLAVTMCHDTTIRGYIYGALLRPTYHTELRTLERPLNKFGTVRHNSDVNIRGCGSVDCEKLFRLNPRDSFKILGVTNYQYNVAAFGNYPWYHIQYNSTEGYLFGALVQVENDYSTDELHILENTSTYHSDNRQRVEPANRGEIGKILNKSATTTIIRPYGRHYYYEIILNSDTGWIYGGSTSARQDPVDCQCVDYIKHSLGIVGPTRNALEWAIILDGSVGVKAHDKIVHFQYKEVTLNETLYRDIAILDKLHPQSDPQFGHIGFVIDIRYNSDNTIDVLIEGGNHKNIEGSYFTKNRCHNVSYKWYRVDQHIKFYHSDN